MLSIEEVQNQLFEIAEGYYQNTRGLQISGEMTLRDWVANIEMKFIEDIKMRKIKPPYIHGVYCGCEQCVLVRLIIRGI